MKIQYLMSVNNWNHQPHIILSHFQLIKMNWFNFACRKTTNKITLFETYSRGLDTDRF